MAVDIEKVEKWLVAGERIQAKIERLHSPNDQPETSAEAAFQHLYYQVATLSPADCKKWNGILNKRRGEVSDLQLKQALGDFLSLNQILFVNADKKKEVLTYLKREDKMPFDDSEARRRNEENQRRVREEAERKRREEERRRQEADRRRQEEERQRRQRAEEEQRRREDPKSGEWKKSVLDHLDDGFMEEWLDNTTREREQYVAEAAKKNGKKSKGKRFVFLLILVALLGGVAYMYRDKLPEWELPSFFNKEKTEQKEPTKQNIYRVVKMVNMRKGPSVKTPKVSLIKKDEILFVRAVAKDEKGYEWGRTTDKKNNDGWVRMDFLEEAQEPEK